MSPARDSLVRPNENQLALLQSAPRAEVSHAAEPRLRRCTFRHVTPVTASRRALPVYDVNCLYPDRAAPVPLGDLASARDICEGCTASGIFRADED